MSSSGWRCEWPPSSSSTRAPSGRASRPPRSPRIPRRRRCSRNLVHVHDAPSGADRAEALPVERDAMAGPRRARWRSPPRCAAAPRYSGRARSRAPRDRSGSGGGEQMHRDVVRAMRRDRQVERLGKPRDLHEGGDAAAIGDIGLGIGDAAAGDQCLNSQSVRRFSPAAIGTPPSRTMRAWPASRRGDRLLEPGQVGGRKARAARIASSTLHFMLASAISGKPSPRCPRMAARARVFGQPRAADLHLDGAEAPREIAVGLLQQVGQRQIEVDAAGVAGHLVGRSRPAASTAAVPACAPSGPTARYRGPRARAPSGRRARHNAGPTRSSARSPRSDRHPGRSTIADISRSMMLRWRRRCGRR